MAQANPVSSNTLNSPSHSALHRIISADVNSPTHCIRVNSDGTSEFSSSNDTSNCTKIEIDGTLVFNGNATVFDDLRFPVTSINPPGSPTAATFDATNIGYSFSNNQTDELFIVAQMPHGWKEGSAIVPHVHWMPTNDNTGNVVWQIQYKWTNINDVESGSYNTIQKIIAGAGVSFTHQSSYFNSIDGGGKKISSIIVFIISRLGSDSSDTYNTAALLREFDIHYEIDTIGSRQITTK